MLARCAAKHTHKVDLCVTGRTGGLHALMGALLIKAPRGTARAHRPRAILARTARTECIGIPPSTALAQHVQ